MIVRRSVASVDRGCNFCLVQSKCQFHPARSDWLSVQRGDQRIRGIFTWIFCFFSWPHVTVRATLARPDDTALAAIDRDGWNAKLRGVDMRRRPRASCKKRLVRFQIKLSYTWRTVTARIPPLRTLACRRRISRNWTTMSMIRTAWTHFVQNWTLSKRKFSETENLSRCSCLSVIRISLRIFKSMPSFNPSASLAYVYIYTRKFLGQYLYAQFSLSHQNIHISMKFQWYYFQDYSKRQTIWRLQTKFGSRNYRN